MLEVGCSVDVSVGSRVSVAVSVEVGARVLGAAVGTTEAAAAVALALKITTATMTITKVVMAADRNNALFFISVNYLLKDFPSGIQPDKHPHPGAIFSSLNKEKTIRRVGPGELRTDAWQTDELLICHATYTVAAGAKKLRAGWILDWEKRGIVHL
jgi:hypothetical protein